MLNCSKSVLLHVDNRLRIELIKSFSRDESLLDQEWFHLKASNYWSVQASIFAEYSTACGNKRTC